MDAVLTEDSDLLVFGCHTVFFKMNASGHGVMIRRQNLENATEIDMRGWNMTKIRHMCILSGCDYLPSLPGIGLKIAHKLLKNYRTIDGVSLCLSMNVIICLLFILYRSFDISAQVAR